MSMSNFRLLRSRRVDNVRLTPILNVSLMGLVGTGTEIAVKLLLAMSRVEATVIVGNILVYGIAPPISLIPNRTFHS